MTDPKRWLDDPAGSGETARRLLLAGKRLSPPPGAVERGWSEFLALNGVPPFEPGGGGAGGAPSPLNGTGLSGAGTGGAGALGAASKLGAVSTGAVVASSAAKLGLPAAALLKTFVLGAALGGATVLAVQGAGHVLSPRKEPPPRAAASAAGEPPFAPRSESPPAPRIARDAPPEVPAETGLRDRPPPALAPGATGAPLGGSLPASGPAEASFPVDVAAHESRLKAEARDVADAKALIAGGRAMEALVLLGQSSERFKGGTLGQEREALIIEAFARSGQTAAARERARAFLLRYPKSPLAERVRELGR